MRPTLFLFAILTAPALAQDTPDIGKLGHTENIETLNYECTLSTQLHCDFVQSMITKGSPATPEEIDAASAELITAAQGELCANVREMGNHLDAVLAEDQLPSSADTDIEVMRAMLEFCDQPTETTARKIALKLADREAQTCSIWSNHFSMSFDWNVYTERWENISTPRGACGVVTFTYLQQSGSFWSFREQRVVTNPQSEDWLFGDCSALEYPPETFDWRPRKAHAQCTYIGL